VGYLGPPGTYSHEVALTYFTPPHATLVPFDTIEDVITAAEEKRVEVSAVPIDNSHEGPVITTLEKLGMIARGCLEKRNHCSSLVIVGEHYHNVEHCLLGVKEVKVEEVEGIYSHPQALGQCRQWLSSHFPRAVIHSVSSTAKAAQMVCSNPKSLAVSSSGAAKEYGLEILHRGIQDSQYNQTRFVFLSSFPVENFLKFSFLFTPANSTRQRTSLYLATGEGDSSLSKIFSSLAQVNANVVAVHSRPIQNSPWKRGYFIDVECTTLPSSYGACVLGSYPVRTDQQLSDS